MNNLEFSRRNRHLTQAQLEAGTGVPQPRLSEYERGMRPPRVHLLTLAHYFGLPEASAESLLAEVPANMAAVEPPPSLRERILRGRQ